MNDSKRMRKKISGRHVAKKREALKLAILSSKKRWKSVRPAYIQKLNSKKRIAAIPAQIINYPPRS